MSTLLPASITAESKRIFARELLRGTPPFEAISRAIPDATLDRVSICREWQYDSEVLKLKKEISADETDEFHNLPSKAEFCRELIEKFREASPKDAASIAKVYADVRGWSGSNSQSTTTTTTVNVMQVMNHGSDAEWERKLIDQQQALIVEGERIADESD